MRFAVGYTMDTMYFTWLDNPVDVDDDLQLPQFFLVKTPKYDCSQNYTAGRAISSGVYNEQFSTVQHSSVEFISRNAHVLPMSFFCLPHSNVTGGQSASRHRYTSGWVLWSRTKKMTQIFRLHPYADFYGVKSAKFGLDFRH